MAQQAPNSAVPYLFFNGQCREALEFYQGVFGGALEVMTYGDTQGDGCPLAMRDLVMHAHLTTGAFRLMASDEPMGPVTTGTNVRIAIDFAAPTALDEAYAALSAGGEAAFPPADQFWGDRFGTLVDRFGVHWMLTAKLAPKG